MSEDTKQVNRKIGYITRVSLKLPFFFIYLIKMLQTITRIIHPLPVPIFGTVGTASAFMCAKSKVLPKLVVSC